MTKSPPPLRATSHTSTMLEALIDNAPPEHFTLRWLVDHLPRHSYGFILLFLAIIALLPVISIPARLLIIVLTMQIILGYHSPLLPKRLMRRKLPSKYLVRLKHHVVPALRCLESIVRPRWPALFAAHGFAHGLRRLIAFVAMLDMALSLPAPIPFANMPPAAVGILLSLAYIEHDGVVLAFAFAAALAMLVLVVYAVFWGLP